MTVYFTSDTHFSDPRVLAIDRRPFASLELHDAALIALWRETVGADDVVWHLGDFARDGPEGRAAAILAQLPGEKHLILGNNDPDSVARDPAWASVRHYAEIEVEGQRLVLCHYPFRTWRDSGKGVIDLHGHSHGRLGPIPRQYDVGVDVWDLRPVTLETIRTRRRRGPPRAVPTAKSRSS
ncbi:metallophosphoesterase family protein [Salinarimonas chemoclinalis]|uniref:metallophosphoesterase family protein n=1 Tax=Salinarimonas chemoclinalis TaxID=3241599 RepID=UPI003556F09C